MLTASGRYQELIVAQPPSVSALQRRVEQLTAALEREREYARSLLQAVRYLRARAARPSGQPLSGKVSYLSASQRALVAARLVGAEAGPRGRWDPGCGRVKVEDAAAHLHVSARSVRYGRLLLREAPPEVIELVDADRLPLRTALELVRGPGRRLRSIVAELKARPR